MKLDTGFLSFDLRAIPYDCTQLYPSFAPALEDPRMAALARDFNAG